MNASLGEAVKIARTIARESQATFSKSFGIAQQTIGEWESTGKVPERHWPKLLEKYNVDARSYVTNKNNQTTTNSPGSIQSGRDTISSNLSTPNITKEDQELVELLLKYGNNKIKSDLRIILNKVRDIST